MRLALVLFLASSTHGYLGSGLPPRGNKPTKPITPTAALPTNGAARHVPDKPRGPMWRLPSLPTHYALPALSYASLATATVGTLHLLQHVLVGWQGVALVGWCVGMPVAMILAQLAATGGSGVAKAMGGVLTEDSRLRELAAEAAAAVGVPTPHVYEVRSREPNAFAASGLGNGDTTVAVTTGLREVLNDNELGAVLAHEMGHLRHRDVVRNMHVATAAAGLGGVYEVGRVLLDASTSRRRKRSKDDDGDGSAGLGLALMAGGMATQLAAHGLRLLASRDAELKADRAAAEVFGADAMISALKKIEASAARRPRDLRESATARQFAFAMISGGAAPAARATRGTGAWAAVKRAFGRIAEATRTHPTLEKRVHALEAAAAAGLVPQHGGRASGGFFW